ncbi:hypothetical protein ACFLR8_04690, partial [Bacteroidota bacterium]
MSDPLTIEYRDQLDLDLTEQISFFVNEHPNGNPFQHPSIFKVWFETSGYKPVFLIGRDDNDTIRALLLAVIQQESGLLKKYFSRRCIITGGPLYDPNLENSNDIVSQLLRSLEKLVNQNTIYTEIRNFYDCSSKEIIFRKAGFSYIPYMNYHVSLIKDITFKRFATTRKQQIKKSLKKGVKIIDDASEDQVFQFYLILKNLYKTRVKKPLPPWSFFREFYHSQIGKYLLLEYQSQIIGGVVCPVFQETIYEWYKAGLDKIYQGVYPSVFAT